MKTQLTKVPQWFPWNGSKRWLLKDLIPILQEWDGKGTFIDPFVGGGCISSAIRILLPEVRQIVSDMNPWLMGAFQSQLYPDMPIPDNYLNLEYWRQIKDTDIERLKLTAEEKAYRFAICLFSAWGNRWKSKWDGSMGSENPVNPKFTSAQYLLGRLQTFRAVRWLNSNDTIVCCDWKETISLAKPGDLVYIDPPYPESLGYGNQWWGFADQLDVVDWVWDAIPKGVKVVLSNMSSLERLYRRIGMHTKIVKGPSSSKTRRGREEVIAWNL